MERRFARHYRTTGLRWSRLAASIGFFLAIGFWGLVQLRVVDADWLHGRQLVRLVCAFLLLICFGVLCLRPRFAIKSYGVSIGVPCAIVCLSIALLIFLPPDIETQQSTRLAIAMTVACWLVYGFTRLPVWLAIMICGSSSSILVVGAHIYENEYLLAIIFYLLVVNVTGWVMLVNGERREREVFYLKSKLVAMAKYLRRVADENLEANKNKSDILTLISHDLRQPLLSAGLYLNSLLLRKSVASDFESLELVRKIKACTALIEDSVQRISEVAFIQKYKEILELSSVDLTPILARVSELFLGQAAGRSIDLRVRDSISCTSLSLTSSAEIWDVVANLVSNSIKYCDPNKKSWILVRLVKIENHFRLSIIDNGMGISEGFHGKIFEEYFQVENSRKGGDVGYGLGLSIVRDTVRRLPGHSLEMKSVLGRGTRFDLWIPVYEDGESNFRRGSLLPADL